MKFLLFSLCIISSLLGFDYKLEPAKVAKDVYCFFGKSEAITKENGGHIANCCYVLTRDGYVVIDSGPTYAFGAQAYAKMKLISPQKVKYVINTHKHDDHWLANGFYKEQGAVIVGPGSLADSVEQETTRIERIVTKDAYLKTKIVYADEYVDQVKVLKVADTTFIIKKLTPVGHTDGDLVVYIPSKIIFTGDLVFNDRVLSLRDGDLKGWLNALDKIEALDWKVLISGHGEIMDKSALELTRNYLQDLQKEVREALDEDVELVDVTEKVRLEKYKNMNMYKLLHNQNVLKAYQILEFEEE